MARLRNSALSLVPAAVLIGIVVWIWLGAPANDSPSGVSPVITSETSGPPAYSLSVLFIGNSFTFTHHIPRQVAEIASSDPGNATQWTIQSVTRGGTDLQALWDEGLALQALASRHWDYVVLQEQSSWPMVEEFTHATYHYAGLFNEAIRRSGAKTLLYLTWVNKPGSPLYDQYSYLVSPNFMYRQFVTVTYELAESLHASVVPVGTYWQMALVQEPLIELYESDGHHPGAAGSYLAALVFYKTLTGRDVTKIGFRPPGVTVEAAQKIKTLVAKSLPAK